MDLGSEPAITVTENPTLGPAIISVFQPRVELPKPSADPILLELRLIRYSLERIEDLITRAARPRTLWERIKEWLGIH